MRECGHTPRHSTSQGINEMPMRARAVAGDDTPLCYQSVSCTIGTTRGGVCVRERSVTSSPVVRRACCGDAAAPAGARIRADVCGAVLRFVCSHNLGARAAFLTSLPRGRAGCGL